MTKIKAFIKKYRFFFLYIPLLIFDFILLFFLKDLQFDSRTDFLVSLYCIFFFLFGLIFRIVLEDYITFFNFLKRLLSKEKSKGENKDV